jgi:hypothetical protein
MRRAGRTRLAAVVAWPHVTLGRGIGDRCRVPMLTSGKISYEVGGNVDAMSFDGIAAVHRMVTKLGLPEADR